MSFPPEDSYCTRFPLSPTGFVSNKVFQVPRERTKQWPFGVALASKCPTVKISSDSIELVPAVNSCDFHARLWRFQRMTRRRSGTAKITSHVIPGREQNGNFGL